MLDVCSCVYRRESYKKQHLNAHFRLLIFRPLDPVARNINVRTIGIRSVDKFVPCWCLSPLPQSVLLIFLSCLEQIPLVPLIQGTDWQRELQGCRYLESLSWLVSLQLARLPPLPNPVLRQGPNQTPQRTSMYILGIRESEGRLTAECLALAHNALYENTYEVRYRCTYESTLHTSTLETCPKIGKLTYLSCPCSGFGQFYLLGPK